MTTAKKGDEVVVAYTVLTGDGRVVGGTDREGPQTLTLGAGSMFPKVDDGITGMTPGEEKTVIVPSDDAFGERREELVLELERDRLTGVENPTPGMELTARNQNGEPLRLFVTAVADTTVTVDGNHPLAGEDLHFSLKLVEVKKAA